MDPRRVLTFRAVAHQRSFSRAARELALSQPSVSNQVASLEREIGVRLLEHADAIAERFELAESQLAAAADGDRARLRIGAFPTALAGLVPAAIERLRSEHPESRITVDEGTDDLPARVRSGELHLAVAFHDAALPREEPEGLVRRDLLREGFMVAMAPDHRLAAESEVRLADLRGDDWTASVADGLIVRACRAAGFEPQLISLTRDQLAIRALVGRGLAVTLAPALLTEAFDDLVLRPIAGPSPARDVYALLPPGGRHPLVSPVLDALDAVAGARGGAPGAAAAAASRVAGARGGAPRRAAS